MGTSKKIPASISPFTCAFILVCALYAAYCLFFVSSSTTSVTVGKNYRTSESFSSLSLTTSVATSKLLQSPSNITNNYNTLLYSSLKPPSNFSYAFSPFDKHSLINIWDKFVPQFNCLSLNRIGNEGDGGKFLCQIESLKDKKNCIIYSYGISDDINFEFSLLKHTKYCEIFAFDPTIGNIPKKRFFNRLKNKLYKKLYRKVSSYSFTNYNNNNTSNSNDLLIKGYYKSNIMLNYSTFLSFDENFSYYFIQNYNTNLSFNENFNLFFQYYYHNFNQNIVRNRIHFHKIALNNYSGKSFYHSMNENLIDTMLKYNHQHINLLKIDIEGSEFNIFESLYKNFYKFFYQNQNINKKDSNLRQSTEYSNHLGLNYYNDKFSSVLSVNSNFLNNNFVFPIGELVIELHYDDNKKLKNLFNILYQFKLVSYSREINLIPTLWKKNPDACEYSFVNPLIYNDLGTFTSPKNNNEGDISRVFSEISFYNNNFYFLNEDNNKFFYDENDHINLEEEDIEIKKDQQKETVDLNSFYSIQESHQLIKHFLINKNFDFQQHSFLKNNKKILITDNKIDQKIIDVIKSMESSELKEKNKFFVNINGVIYFLTKQSNFERLKKSFKLFYVNFLRYYPQYPVVIFHDDLTQSNMMEIEDIIINNSFNPPYYRNLYKKKHVNFFQNEKSPFILQNFEYNDKVESLSSYKGQSVRRNNETEVISLDENFEDYFVYDEYFDDDDKSSNDYKSSINHELPSVIFYELHFKLPNELKYYNIPEKTQCDPEHSTLGYRHMCQFHTTVVHEELRKLNLFSPELSILKQFYPSGTNKKLFIAVKSIDLPPAKPLEVIEDISKMTELEEFDNNEIEYIWRLDDDSLIHDSIGYDPFKLMKINKKKYGYVSIIKDNDVCVDGLWETSASFVKDNEKLITNKNNFFKSWPDPYVFYNNFEISHFSIWRTKLWREYSQYITSNGGIYMKRWGDAPIHTIGVSLLLDREDIYRFSDMNYYHSSFLKQNSSGLPLIMIDSFQNNYLKCNFYNNWRCFLMNLNDFGYNFKMKSSEDSQNKLAGIENDDDYINTEEIEYQNSKIENSLTYNSSFSAFNSSSNSTGSFDFYNLNFFTLESLKYDEININKLVDNFYTNFIPFNVQDLLLYRLKNFVFPNSKFNNILSSSMQEKENVKNEVLSIDNYFEKSLLNDAKFYLSNEVNPIKETQIGEDILIYTFAHSGQEDELFKTIMSFFYHYSFLHSDSDSSYHYLIFYSENFNFSKYKVENLLINSGIKNMPTIKFFPVNFVDFFPTFQDDKSFLISYLNMNQNVQNFNPNSKDQLNFISSHYNINPNFLDKFDFNSIEYLNFKESYYTLLFFNLHAKNILLKLKYNWFFRISDHSTLQRPVNFNLIKLMKSENYLYGYLNKLSLSDDGTEDIDSKLINKTSLKLYQLGQSLCSALKEYQSFTQCDINTFLNWSKNDVILTNFEIFHRKVWEGNRFSNLYTLLLTKNKSLYKEYIQKNFITYSDSDTNVDSDAKKELSNEFEISYLNRLNSTQINLLNTLIQFYNSYTNNDVLSLQNVWNDASLHTNLIIMSLQQSQIIKFSKNLIHYQYHWNNFNKFSVKDLLSNYTLSSTISSSSSYSSKVNVYNVRQFNYISNMNSLGWIGGDIAYSIPLPKLPIKNSFSPINPDESEENSLPFINENNNIEYYKYSSSIDKVIWLYGDSILGQSSNQNRLPNYKFISNTVGISSMSRQKTQFVLDKVNQTMYILHNEDSKISDSTKYYEKNGILSQTITDFGSKKKNKNINQIDFNQIDMDSSVCYKKEKDTVIELKKNIFKINKQKYYYNFNSKGQATPIFTVSNEFQNHLCGVGMKLLIWPISGITVLPDSINSNSANLLVSTVFTCQNNDDNQNLEKNIKLNNEHNRRLYEDEESFLNKFNYLSDTHRKLDVEEDQDHSNKYKNILKKNSYYENNKESFINSLNFINSYSGFFIVTNPYDYPDEWEYYYSILPQKSTQHINLVSLSDINGNQFVTTKNSEVLILATIKSSTTDDENEMKNIKYDKIHQILLKIKVKSLLKFEYNELHYLNPLKQWKSFILNKPNENLRNWDISTILPYNLFSPAFTEASLFYDATDKRWKVLSLHIMNDAIQLCESPKNFLSEIEEKSVDKILDWNCKDLMSIPKEWQHPTILNYGAKIHPHFLSTSSKQLDSSNEPELGNKMSQCPKQTFFLTFVNNAITPSLLTLPEYKEVYTPKFYYLEIF